MERKKLKTLIKLFLQRALRLEKGRNLRSKDILEEAGIKKKKIYDLTVNIGFGQGTPTNTPYIAFLGYGQKTQKGIYPVLLFYRKLKNIPNLIVAYGVSENQKPTLKWQIVKKQTVGEFFKECLSDEEIKKKVIKKEIRYLESFVANTFKIEKEEDITDELLDQIALSLEKVIENFHRQFKSFGEDEEMQVEKKLFRDLILEPLQERAFYNALRTKPFVILAGPSGTGKTKIVENLVQLFDECFLKTEKGEFLLEGDCLKLHRLAENINAYLRRTGRGPEPQSFIKIGKYFLPLRALGFKENKTTEQCRTIARDFQLEEIEIKEPQNLKKLRESVKVLDLGNFLFFPIKPEFRDSRSLLGFYNPLTGKYQTTHLLKFILKAAKNYLRKGKSAYPFFVLLDEMNLARVEYYFADFLSVLEAKKFSSWEETLSAPSFKEFVKTLGVEKPDSSAYLFSSQSIKLHLEEEIEKEQGIPRELFLPPNLYFVGTINVDETTYPLSPKVLDRGFILEFEVGSFDAYLNYLEETSEQNFQVELKEDFTRGGKFATIDKKEIRNYCQSDRSLVQLLEEINQILKKYGFHFGYRVFDEIVSFVANSQNSKLKIEKNKAVDYALKSKILPKLNGVRQRLEKPVEELLNFLLEEHLGMEDIASLPWFEHGILRVELEEKGTIDVKTDYPQTVAKLLEMFYKLKTEGFASFI